ncbi:MAG TPA: hypothetical protein VI076_10220 [Actinopolymorphaceae bacterium]
MLDLSTESRILAGILLLALVTVESGGFLMLRVLRGKQQVTELQTSFYRAGHAHAGVWVTLGLIVLVLVDASGLTGPAGYVARLGVPIGAILLPAGFFLSVIGPGATRPNRLVLLVHAGAVSFALGVLAAGIGLLTAG